MEEIGNDSVQNIAGQGDETGTMIDCFDRLYRDHEEIKESIQYLQDLFVRRLNEDKQKNEMIKQLQQISSFAVIEPFVSDMLLILDRINGNQDDFVMSIGEELYDALSRRGLKRIDAFGRFDPAVHKAVRMAEGDSVDVSAISQVVRDGYTFNGRVIRPAEVVVIGAKNI